LLLFGAEPSVLRSEAPSDQLLTGTDNCVKSSKNNAFQSVHYHTIIPFLHIIHSLALVSIKLNVPEAGLRLRPQIGRTDGASPWAGVGEATDARASVASYS
jgi:hypothetical protein